MKTTRTTVLAVVLAGAVCALPWGRASAQDADADIAARIRHYTNVEAELLKADVSHLTPEQRTERRRVIHELRAYRERADFGINRAFPGERRPYFVDDHGRRCAVAHLLHRWGEDDLVEHVTRSDNFAYVSDLAGSEELGEWLDRVGLSVREAARIQAPTVGDGPGDDIGQGTPTNDDSGGSSPGTSSDGGSTSIGGITRRASAGSSGSVGADSWWLWWEFNKLSFFQRNTLRVPGEATAGAMQDAADKAALDRRRRAVAESIGRDLSHADARVRAAAAIAVGRIGQDGAEALLLPLLDDPQQTVREAAILAIGATGSPTASKTLLRIASTGKHGKRGGSLSPNSRGVALLALGLARRAGEQTDHAAAVARIVEAGKKRDAAQAGTGAMLYHRLAPGGALGRTAAAIAEDRNAPDAARARAVEELAKSEDELPLRDLQRALAGRELELRRSAALALAGADNDLVLPRLMTAFELESEPLTRGFLLLGIGEQGGEEARTFLGKQLRKGKGSMRAWAALALGVAARTHDDDGARELLRSADLPIAQRGAVWLARGLARDTEAFDDLSKALRDESNPRTRAHAAGALGMLGGDRARFQLLTANAKEKSRLVRSTIAVAIGTLGAPEDADVLIDALRDAEDPALQGTLAVALGVHGSVDALTGLETVLGAENADPAQRATAIQAIGILLDRRGPMVLPEISSRTNYATMPRWVMAALQTAL